MDLSDQATRAVHVSTPRPQDRVVDRTQRGAGRRRGDALAAWALLTPNLIAYALFIVIPAVTGVVLGFYSWDLFSTPEWVGLANYSTLLHDPLVASALWHSILFVVLGVVPTVLVGFLFATLLDWQARFVGAIRLLYFLPLVVSTAVAGVLWSTLYSPAYGMVDRILGLLHIPGPSWLASTTWALPALTVVIIWLSLPLVVILYLAGLQRVPSQIHEAARIDGAGMWLRVWAITWPNVWSTTLLVAMLEILQFLAAPFEVGLIMTYGGPLDATTSMSFYAYRQAFEFGKMGYASAISMVQFFVLLAVVGVGGLAVRRWGRRTA
jgi:multiple sugar transport system permease protein